MKAIWNGTVVAESDATIVVEGNHYFPPDALKTEFFRVSNRHSLCPWKGWANYYDVDVNGEVSERAAWYYPKPSFLARRIRGYVAFWNGVRVES